MKFNNCTYGSITVIYVNNSIKNSFLKWQVEVISRQCMALELRYLVKHKYNVVFKYTHYTHLRIIKMATTDTLKFTLYLIKLEYSLSDHLGVSE